MRRVAGVRELGVARGELDFALGLGQIEDVLEELTRLCPDDLDFDPLVLHVCTDSTRTGSGPKGPTRMMPVVGPPFTESILSKSTVTSHPRVPNHSVS